jgi:hypothetical protein
VDAAAHYRHLAQLGRDEFLAASAPTALVRSRREGADAGGLDDGTLTVEHSIEDPDYFAADPRDLDELELFPLVKKAGASFPDRITIGRTSNNDVAFNEVSISRFHAYLRFEGGRYLIADAGSKNGSFLDGLRLEPRKERTVMSKSVIRLGDVELTFYVAADLYAALGGR